jgi:hypothetical protein
MKDFFDNEIKRALHEKADNINAPNLLASIEVGLKEEKNMKKFRFTPKAILISVAATIVLVTGVIGAGKIAYTRSSSSHLDDIVVYPSVSEVAKIVDYSPKFVENLGGHPFKFANPGNSQKIDDSGNVVGEYKDITFWYETEKSGAILTLGTNPTAEGLKGDENAEELSYKNIKMYYTSCIYKAVPPSYEKTEEDIRLEESGELMIGFGADEIEEKKTQSIVWYDDGITYDLLDMDAEIQKDDLIAMAKQVADVKTVNDKAPVDESTQADNLKVGIK